MAQPWIDIDLNRERVLNQYNSTGFRGKSLLKRFIAIVFISLNATLALAQEKIPDGMENQPGSNLEIFNPLTSFNILACILCVVVGIIVFAGQFYLLIRAQNVTADDIVRNCTITLVIIGALILIVAGYNSQQTAQAFGLFGTVIGYLLGRSAGRAEGKE